MFAALNTVEPPILELVTAKILEGDRPWAEERLPLVKDRIRDRLVQLSARLGDADWLDGPFSAGDLMMVSVLLRLRPSGLLDEFPELAAYLPAARHVPHTNGPSPPNGRSTPLIRKPADERPSWVAVDPALGGAAISLRARLLLGRHSGTLDLTAARRGHQKRAAERVNGFSNAGTAQVSAVGAEARLRRLRMHGTDLALVAPRPGFQ